MHDLAIPLIDSPLFPQLLESGRFGAHQALAEQLHRDGYALIDLGRERVAGLAQQIQAALAPGGALRVQDAWREVEAVRQLALEPVVLETLRCLWGRERLPFRPSISRWVPSSIYIAMPCTFTANRPDSCAEYGWRQIGRCRGNFEWHHRSEIAPDSIIQQCASTNVVHSWNHGPRSPPKRTPVRPPAQPRTHGPAIGPELVQPCPVAGQHRRIPAGIVPNRISTDIPTQTPLRHIPAQLRRMLQIRFRPAVPIGVGIRAPGNGSRPLPHGMRERSCAEIRVSPEISGDHIHTQLQGF